MAEVYRIGQRWVSQTEPELGLGLIGKVEGRRLQVEFPAAKENRIYASASAPLRRIVLKVGQKARGRDSSFVVEKVEDSQGLFIYHGQGRRLREQDLLDSEIHTDPVDKLLSIQLGRTKEFSLRLKTLELRKRALGSPVRGLIGGRVELLHHQLYIAHEVAERHRARVLLADEVGLGKTIEAGMVFHRMHVNGQARRVLVLAPGPLVHQWLIELYRRFHQLFTVLDEETIRQEAKGDKSYNPFAARQTIICAMDFLQGRSERVGQAVEAGIDLLIVDEAHHLAWSARGASDAYVAVERLAKVSKSVLLLTATPVQLGQESHFGRLRLLDPMRFSQWDIFLEQETRYRLMALLAERIQSLPRPDLELEGALGGHFAADKELLEQLEQWRGGSDDAKGRLLDALIDRHGTGRVMFRNRRNILKGFPRRLIEPAALAAPDALRMFFRKVHESYGEWEKLDNFRRLLLGPPGYLPKELAGDENENRSLLARAWEKDPRLPWLAELLRTHPEEKFLLICSDKSLVFALQEALPRLTTEPFTVFHENVMLTTRDRNAAYFAMPGGARLLVSSEIGSEGRNFQFASHLVLFDLPLNPSVLEQRIGRLDRIGQKGDIHIHIPYLSGTPQEVLFRWYHEALDAFQRPLLGAEFFFDRLIEPLISTCRLVLEESLTSGGIEATELRISDLMRTTQQVKQEIQQRIEEGRDRLLEMHSCNIAEARKLQQGIHEEDSRFDAEEYLSQVCDHFGVEQTQLPVPRGHHLLPGSHMFVDHFPGLPEDGMQLTFDRGTALVREDLEFVTLEHPLMSGALDLMLHTTQSYAGFAEWSSAPRDGLALDLVFVLEAAAPLELGIGRYLPPTPIRVLLGPEGRDISDLFEELDMAELKKGPAMLLEENAEEMESWVNRSVLKAREAVDMKAIVLRQDAARKADVELGRERDRALALSRVNPTVTPEDVAHYSRRLENCLIHIRKAELRLDSLRMVLMRK